MAAGDELTLSDAPRRGGVEGPSIIGRGRGQANAIQFAAATPDTKVVSSPRQRSQAFTFVEMIVAVAILAIVAAVVVPMAGKQADVRLSAASRKVLGDLAYAQSLAVASRQSVYVRFSTNKYDVCTLVGTALTVMANPVDQQPYAVTFGTTATDSSLKNVTMAVPSFGANADRVLGFDATGQPFAYAESLRVTTAIATRSTVALASEDRTLPIYVEALTGELHVP